MSVNASDASPTSCTASIGAQASASAGLGGTTLNSEAKLALWFEHEEWCGQGCCAVSQYDSRVANFADSRASASVQYNFRPDSHPVLKTTLTFERTFSMNEGDCNGTSQVLYFSSVHLESRSQGSFYSVRNKWYPSNGDPPQYSISQGFIAEVFDGISIQHVCLGEIPQNCPPTGSFDVQHEAPQGISSVETTVLFDSFTKLDGDLDGNGYLCANDRATMLAAQGSVINVDATYNPRADFDLDGVIDSDDLTAFDALFNAQPDCNANGNPDNCDIAAGASQDADSNGVPDECEAPYGACCRPDGSCALTLYEYCDGPCEAFWGEGYLCGQVSCTSSPLKACCKPNNQGCEVMTECECNAINGFVVNSPTCNVFCPAKPVEHP